MELALQNSKFYKQIDRSGQDVLTNRSVHIIRCIILSLPRILKSPKTVIHVNLCSALLIANILLLIGSAATKYKVLVSTSLYDMEL